eukprot:scaffold23298_cov96-Isochrysis_galbana.AAC.1
MEVAATTHGIPVVVAMGAARSRPGLEKGWRWKTADATLLRRRGRRVGGGESEGGIGSRVERKDSRLRILRLRRRRRDIKFVRVHRGQGIYAEGGTEALSAERERGVLGAYHISCSRAVVQTVF